MDGFGSDCLPKGSLEKVFSSASPKDSDSELACRAGETDEVNAPASDKRLARTTAAADAIMVHGSIALQLNVFYTTVRRRAKGWYS